LKIQPQDIHRKAVAIFRVWIRTLRGLRYPGIGSLSEYEPILKIFAIYVEFSTVQSINSKEVPDCGFRQKFFASGLNRMQKEVIIFRLTFIIVTAMYALNVLRGDMGYE